MDIAALPSELLAALYGWLDRASAGRLSRTGRAMREAGMSCAPLDDMDLSVRPATRADLWALLERFPHARVQSLRLVRGGRDAHPDMAAGTDPRSEGGAQPAKRRRVVFHPLASLLREPPFRALRHLAVTMELAGGSGGTARLLRVCGSLRSVELYTEGRVGAEVWHALAALGASAVAVRVMSFVGCPFVTYGGSPAPCGPVALIARSVATLVLPSHAVAMAALSYPTCDADDDAAPRYPSGDNHDATTRHDLPDDLSDDRDRAHRDPAARRRGPALPGAAPMYDCASRLRVLAARLLMPERAPGDGVPRMPALEVLHLYGGRVHSPTLLRWLVDGCPRLTHLCVATCGMQATAGASWTANIEARRDLVLELWRCVVPRLDTFALSEHRLSVPDGGAPAASRLRRLLLSGHAEFLPHWISQHPLEELHLLNSRVFGTGLASRLRDGRWPALRRLTVCAATRVDRDVVTMRELAAVVRAVRPRCDMHLALKAHNDPWCAHATADADAPCRPCPAGPFAAMRDGGGVLCGTSFRYMSDYQEHLMRGLLEEAL